ncbi:hypothetical protein K6119_05550 [Paracrocinitomix mangrovi]|uniref:hypothetical protein n=1 Tax=Paracrocinitomix mangrovi TaxID=2862509 RepID=UPI001C8D208A|nr:hypothetical protein [Paracrocinitomix mangrovi]UKN02979.1 hypothetical protein K6119_05550 [Paracrocinitomix mangrovi]
MKLYLLLSFVVFTTYVNAQIVSGETPNEKEEKEKKEKPEKEPLNRDSLTGTTYYLTGLYTYGYRSFTDNTPYQSYEEWNDQKADMSGGASIGFFVPVAKNLDMDLGFTFFGSKEKYDYASETTDTTFHFSNTYMQIGVPIKLRYTIGEKFQFFGVAGITPLNLINVRYNENYTRNSGDPVNPDVTVVKDKLAMFNLMASAGFGINYNFDLFGFTLYPEYRHQLLNTYDATKSIDHKMYGLGIHAGLLLRL